ncbi:NUDIX hydrolase, partial [Candidatus Gracilibacteria bacterium]|nr:NUDIX hydrolase [Candidatus Gracilibacteria bacterium]
QEEWDFVKGGMLIGENENQTLTREIQEELGKDFKYEIIGKSEWNIIYEWPEEYKKNKGFRGQARISYWIKYLGGSIRLQENELQAYKWVNIKNLKKFMLKSYYSLFQYEIFKKDYLRIKNKFNNIK